MVGLTPISMPLELPIWGLASLKISRLELHAMLGEPHYIETDPLRTCGGNQDAWAFSLQSVQRVFVVFDVTSSWAEVFGQPAELAAVLQALGIQSVDPRLKHHEPVEMK